MGRGQRHGGALLRAHAAIDGRVDVLAQTPARLTDEQRQQHGREKAVAQRMPLVLRMVVDEHADDPGAVAGQQDARHAGDVPPLFEQRRHALHRLVRDLVRLPVDHVGDGRRAQTQLLRDITDAYTLLHRLCPRFCPYFIRPAQRSQRQHRQNHRISEKDACVLRRFRI